MSLTTSQASRIATTVNECRGGPLTGRRLAIGYDGEPGTATFGPEAVPPCPTLTIPHAAQQPLTAAGVKGWWARDVEAMLSQDHAVLGHDDPHPACPACAAGEPGPQRVDRREEAVARAGQAQRALDSLDADRTATQETRDRAVKNALVLGASHSRLADATGLSRGRIGQISQVTPNATP